MEQFQSDARMMRSAVTSGFSLPGAMEARRPRELGDSHLSHTTRVPRSKFMPMRHGNLRSDNLASA